MQPLMPEMNAVFERMRGEIRGVLDEEQRRRFDRHGRAAAFARSGGMWAPPRPSPTPSDPRSDAHEVRFPVGGRRRGRPVSPGGGLDAVHGTALRARDCRGPMYAGGILSFVPHPQPMKRYWFRRHSMSVVLRNAVEALALASGNAGCDGRDVLDGGEARRPDPRFRSFPVTVLNA